MTYSVDLYVYDLSQGLAKSVTPFLLSGKKIEGIWHTGVVVYGREYFFGSNGLQFVMPGMTILGHTYQAIPMGSTQIPQEIFEDHLKELSKDAYRPDTYHLLDHNCNNFSNEACLFLIGKNIPSHITSLPKEILNSPLGSFLRPLIDELYKANNQVLTVSSNPLDALNKDNSKTSKDGSNNSSSGDMSQHSQQNTIGQISHRYQNQMEHGIQLSCHRIDDMEVLMVQLETLEEFDSKLKVQIQNCLEDDKTILSNDEICYLFNELVQLVKGRHNPMSAVACELLQAFIMKFSSTSNLILNGSRNSFFELIEDFTANPEIPEILLILARCVCNLLCHVGQPNQFFGQSPNHLILIDFLILIVLMGDVEIGSVACQSISNVFLLQCRELHNLESKHGLCSETFFRIGISLFEVIQKNISIDDNHICYCIYQCLKNSTEFLQFARAMYLSEDVFRNYFTRTTSNENIDKLKASMRRLLSQDELL